jgi:hypothetical protein
MKTRCDRGGIDRKGRTRLILFSALYPCPYVAYNIMGSGGRVEMKLR